MSAKSTKKNMNTGSTNTKVVLGLLLVVVLILAGWLYYDNRNQPEVPVEFQTETGTPPLPVEFTAPSAEEQPAP